MIKVGLLVESGRIGIETVVCRRICSLLNIEHQAQIEVDIVSMDNKRRLLNECATATAALLASGCTRVVILWDERPAWPSMHEELCWHRDREYALSQLTADNIPIDRVHLVCIEREFESWLMFDHNMLSRVLSKPTHKVTFPKVRRPDRNKNPKGTLGSKIKELSGMTYVDVNFAPMFAKELDSLNRLFKCVTFKRFASRLTGIDFEGGS